MRIRRINKIFFLFIFTFILSFNVNAQEIIVDFNEEGKVVLNEELRKIKEDLRIESDSSTSLTSDVTGILPLSNGGTGEELTDPDADRIIFWDDSESEVTFLTAGSNLTLSGTTLSADDQSSSSSSNLVYSWSGHDYYDADKVGIYVGTSLTPDISGGNFENNIFFLTDESTAKTILSFKFKKISDINNIDLHARIWSGTTTSTQEAVCTATVGGQSTSVTSTTSSTPTWYTAGTSINVSGLDDDTTYDATISLRNETGSIGAYLSAVTLIGY